MVPTYVLENALSNVFCFPYYSYPVILVVCCLIQIAVLKVHSKYQKYQWVPTNEDQHQTDDNETSHQQNESNDIMNTVNAINYGTNDTSNNQTNNSNKREKTDSEIVIKLIDKNKELIAKYFEKYTPLPQHIIDLIVNDLFYDDNEKELWCKELDEKAERICRYFNWYLLLVCLVYLWCFILIIWINIDWIDDNNINSWHGFQSLTLSMIIFHPSSKVLTPLIIMIDEENTIYKTVKTSMGVNYVLIGLFNGCAYLIYGLPSIFYYIVIWLVYGLFVFGYIFLLMKMDDCDDDSAVPWCIMLPIMIIYCFMMYGCIVYSMVSMSCVYSKDLNGYGQWYMCLYQSLFSPHCPNVDFIYVDWSNWKAITLFVAWILF